MAVDGRLIVDLLRRALRTITRSAPSRGDLIRRLPKGTTGAEIGVWKGEFSERLLRGLRPQQLYLVDPWKVIGPAGSLDARRLGYFGPAGFDQSEMDKVAGDVAKRFSTDSRVRIYRMRSQQFFEQALAEGLALDWIYIDGDHSLESVKADLRGAWSVVKAGGIIAGDDYFLKRETGLEPVRNAVEAFCQEVGVTAEVQGTQYLMLKP